MNKYKLTSFLLVLILFFTLVSSASAHRQGIPILKINNKLVEIYFDKYFSGNVFDLPYDADRAPENYVINQPLEFELDISKFPITPEILEKSEFIWKFGDGTEERTTGKVKSSHTYNKTGTFAFEILVDVKNLGYSDIEPQSLQTAIINILPNKDYKLPEAYIKVNGKLINYEPESSNSSETSEFIPTNTFKLDLNKNISFDASDSRPGETKIKKYRWNFGQDNKESNNIIDSYRYKLPLTYVSVILRVEDENGYYTDTFVNLENTGQNEENNPSADNGLKFLAIMAGAMAIVMILFFGVYGVALILHKKRKNKTK